MGPPDRQTGNWSDVSDGTLDGTLSFDSFQIQYTDSLGNHEGILYIEDLWVLTPGDVAVRETDLPGDFILEQNYPNPFNPFTTIPYRLSAGSTCRPFGIRYQRETGEEPGPRTSGRGSVPRGL
ncbi:MAG: hypothetical protein U5N26_08125 [Candidatus Marinimicrobia bacterium]|nr:hypothetical protein [Candidatus Neomarinimicrobiota bacterium]